MNFIKLTLYKQFDDENHEDLVINPNAIAYMHPHPYINGTCIYIMGVKGKDNCLLEVRESFYDIVRIIDDMERSNYGKPVFRVD